MATRNSYNYMSVAGMLANEIAHAELPSNYSVALERVPTSMTAHLPISQQKQWCLVLSKKATVRNRGSFEIKSPFVADDQLPSEAVGLLSKRVAMLCDYVERSRNEKVSEFDIAKTCPHFFLSRPMSSSDIATLRGVFNANVLDRARARRERRKLEEVVKKQVPRLSTGTSAFAGSLSLCDSSEVPALARFDFPEQFVNETKNQQEISAPVAAPKNNKLRRL